MGDVTRSRRVSTAGVRTITFLLGLVAVTAFGDAGPERLIAPPSAVVARAVVRSEDRIVVLEATLTGVRALISDFDVSSASTVSLSSVSVDGVAATDGRNFLLRG